MWGVCDAKNELFSYEFQDQKITLIHDNALQFTSIDCSWHDIEGVNICSYAPNMNTYVERLKPFILPEQRLKVEKVIGRVIRLLFHPFIAPTTTPFIKCR